MEAQDEILKIVIAAIRFKMDGIEIIMTGVRHVDICEEMHDRGLVPDAGSRIDGFLTSRHLFVDRVEAFKIATAAEQLNEEGKQFHKDYPTVNELFSEDVW